MANDDFFYTYFIRPIYSGEGYNIFNTIAYSFVLLAFLYIIYKISKRIGFKWDINALIASAPFIALTSFARVLTDAGIYERGFWTVTPGIEVLILIPSVLFILGVYHFFREKYVKICFVVGSLLALSQLLSLSYPNPLGMLLISLYTAVSVIPLKLLRKRIDLLKPDLNFIALAVHFFDAAATSVSIRFFSYAEQHVLPSFMISILGPETMFLLKAIFVGLALWIIRDVEDADVIRIVIIFLGLGPALRDSLRLVAMT
jgi:uncharacterized membrane protein